jgi:hypothetical protein
MPKRKGSISLFAVSLCALSGCGGESGNNLPQIPVVAPVVVPPSKPVGFEKIVSTSFYGSVGQFTQGVDVFDFNRDGVKDIIIGRTGGINTPISMSDPKTVILFSNTSYQYTSVDMSGTSPTGIVNDWIFLPETNGKTLVVGIDTGREVQITPEYWAKMPIYEISMNGIATELTNTVSANYANFWHSAYGTADFNGDGLQDFAVGSLAPPSLSIFEQSTSGTLINTTNTVLPPLGTWLKGNDGTGTAVVVPSKNGINYVVSLPYVNNPNTHIFGINMDHTVSNQTIDNTQFLGADWGFCGSYVADVNNDGLMDFVAIAENGKIHTGEFKFETFIQNADGTFSAFASMSTEPVNPMRPVGPLDTVWSSHRFEMADYNGDGKVDIFWGDNLNGAFTSLPQELFFGDGSGHFERNTDLASRIFSGVTWDGTARVMGGDFNGDGIGDLFVLQDTGNLITPILYINHGGIL